MYGFKNLSKEKKTSNTIINTKYKKGLLSYDSSATNFNSVSGSFHVKGNQRK